METFSTCTAAEIKELKHKNWTNKIVVVYEVGMAESPSIAAVVSTMLCCDLVSIDLT